MTYFKRYFYIVIFIVIFLVAPLAVFAEEKTGQAIFKDFIIEKDGTEVQVVEPIILFEGQNYLPLKAVTNSLEKNVYLNESTGQLEIVDSFQTVETDYTLSMNKSKFRPSITFSEGVSSKGVLIMEDDENNIMFEKNGFTTFFPASTTKVLTALIALEQGNLDDKVLVSENVNKLPGDSSRVFIQPGDELTLEQLLYGMLLSSGNDSALAIAEHIAGTESAFAKLMNEKAIEIGATHSNFVNSHGYHHYDHYTTPYDLALILKAASEHPKFLEIINTPAYKAVYKNKKGKQVVRNWGTTNSFLKSSNLYVNGIIGGKTGYTDAAGRNLVTIAEQNGHRYFVVALKGDSLGRYKDTRKLLLNAYKVREKYDRETIKQIQIIPYNQPIEFAGHSIPSDGQLFIYKGRSYISQSLLSKLLADIQPVAVEEAYVKMEIRPKFVVQEPIVEPLYTMYSKEQGEKEKRSAVVAFSAASINKIQLFLFAYRPTLS